jgi:transcription antitermination factor NusG
LFIDSSVSSSASELSSLESVIYGNNPVAGPFQEKSASVRWFALRVKSNFERITALHLREKGYQEFLPVYSVRSRWSDRIKSIEKPLFPGYVFCNFSPYTRLPILTTPGVLHIVGIGKEPVPVDDLEIAALWKTLRSGLSLQPWPFLQLGERVVVERGPLTGVEGIVARFKGEYRLVLSISLLQRSIAAEIERDWIRPTQTAGRDGK